VELSGATEFTTEWSCHSPQDGAGARRRVDRQGNDLGAGPKNDWDFFAAEAGDNDWTYDSVLAIYRRIEDWHGMPDPSRRGTGGLLLFNLPPIRIQSRLLWWRPQARSA
jgi:hypothetical protein